MGKLQVLPTQLANLIAAGEVVGRPSSVVKELMENAIDSGADSISTIISDAGRTLIQVIDNGCGMSPADAVLCFERHATSKIASQSDLESIMTFGFRGEALASIAAVAEVTLKTRRSTDQTATQVRIGSDRQTRSSSISAPIGSNFAVRSLFYNTPARRKFLKSDNIEFKHIVEEFIRIALTRPTISFSLSHNGKEIFSLPKAKSLKFRAQDLLGKNLMTELVDISAETSVVKVSGFIGRPDTARKTLGNQFFFINGRYFRSPYLHKAVMKAYEELIPQGQTPSYFIYMEADPHTIDVNIHPTKTEIKFEDESVVFQTLYAMIKEAVGKHSFGASLDFDTAGAVELPHISPKYDQYKAIDEPIHTLDPTYDPFNPYKRDFSTVQQNFEYGTEAFATHSIMPRDEISACQSDVYAQCDSSQNMSDPQKRDSDYSKYIDKRDDYGRLFEQKVASKTLTIQGKYILAPVASGVMIVHIQRARERILFDQTLRVLRGSSHVTQTSLFPVQVQLGVPGRLLFEANAKLLSELGFDIVPSGVDSVVVNGVPEGYSCEPGKVESLIVELADILSDSSTILSELLQQRMAERLAYLGASGADSLVSPVEAQKLIDTLFASDNAEHTSNGRRIVNILALEDIDKLF